jgi:hypothetical protein
MNKRRLRTKKGGKNNKKTTMQQAKTKGNLDMDNEVQIKNNPLKCSPKAKGEVNDFSCYTDKTLYKMRAKWNARHTDAKIQSNDPKIIHKMLTDYFKGVCNKESCWLKQNAVFGDMKHEMTDSFAPVSPSDWEKNPNEWLTSVDIMNVMKQYEKAYKCFDFLGPSPIDFDTRKMYGECVWDELCNFNLAHQLNTGKTKIGMIFNTDPHDKPGQHWISMFVDVKKQMIFFFDSVGDKIPKQVMVLVDRIKEQGLAMTPPINFAFDQNHPVEHQYGTTECGVYSLYFIVHMLEDKLTKEYLKTHIIKDKYMENFRDIYFNDSL